MQPLSWIFWNSVAMFVASIVAGTMPMVMNMSDTSLKMMNIVGAGLMVGTALAVIIPEGTEALSDAYRGDEVPHGMCGGALVFGFLLMLALDSVNFGAKRGCEGGGGKGGCIGESGSSDSHKGHLPVHRSSLDVPDDDDSTGKDASRKRGGGHIWQQPGFTTLVGILVHSGADGIAMGTSAMSENVSTSVLVFAAIMLHKAPMAFGLSTYLLNNGWGPAHLRQALLMFSAAAPLVAVLGYMLLGSIPLFSAPASIAVCLLLSGGTFLYAACIHVLPEALAKGGDHGHHQPLTTPQVLAITFGSVIPLIFSMSLHHSHGGDHGHGHGHGGEHDHGHHDHGHAHEEEHHHHHSY